MYFFIVLTLTMMSSPCLTSASLSIDELEDIFASQFCIEGALVSMPTGPTLITTAPAQQQSIINHLPSVAATEEKQSTSETLLQTTQYLNNTNDKTPMCLINELARFNKIQQQYHLTSEQGPAHKKKYIVTLELGNEEYEAEGSSIKKAQQSAAAEALAKTQFKHPLQKSTRHVRTTEKQDSKDVRRQLNSLAMKRGERIIYVLETVRDIGYHRNDIYSPQGHQIHQPTEKFIVVLQVGTREFAGEGFTIQAARHDAASKALHELKQLSSSGDMKPTIFNENKIPDLNTELKSPISLVHETALKRNLDVIFEVTSEKGPPHMKEFRTVCRVGDLISKGEGNSKKDAKKHAAENMLEELSKLPALPVTSNLAPRLKRKRNLTKKKLRNLIKGIQEKSGLEFCEDINPVSRLIQIQQAGKQMEPRYAVIEKRGRDFVMEASVNSVSCTGIGSNKKLAKRAAAEALLEKLGYSKSGTQSSIMIDKESNGNETQYVSRKVQFMEDKNEGSVIGRGGRQPVPGVLLMGDQNTNYQAQGQGKINLNKQQTTTITKDTNSSQHGNNMQPTTHDIRSKDQLLNLAQRLGVQVQFSDFPKANQQMYLTLVSLSTKPPQVCHGQGPTTEASHEKAALRALTVLSELGLDVIPKKEQSSVDGLHVLTDPLTIKSGINNGLKK